MERRELGKLQMERMHDFQTWLDVVGQCKLHQQESSLVQSLVC